jgi:predicted dehydrogenase
MRTVVFGSGNVAWHLCPALANAGLSIEAVYARNLTTAAELADRLGTIAVPADESLPDTTELVVLMVPDDQLPALSLRFSHLEIPVIHTSGSIPLEVLNCKHRGVL